MTEENNSCKEPNSTVEKMETSLASDTSKEGGTGSPETSHGPVTAGSVFSGLPDAEEEKKEIDLNNLFPEEENDLNALFPEEDIRHLLKGIKKNRKDMQFMKERFSRDEEIPGKQADKLSGSSANSEPDNVRG